MNHNQFTQLLSSHSWIWITMTTFRNHAYSHYSVVRVGRKLRTYLLSQIWFVKYIVHGPCCPCFQHNSIVRHISATSIRGFSKCWKTTMTAVETNRCLRRNLSCSENLIVLWSTVIFRFKRKLLALPSNEVNGLLLFCRVHQHAYRPAFQNHTRYYLHIHKH